MEEKKIETIRERFTINKDFYKILKKEAHIQGKNESQMMNHILYEYLVKKDNRLSNHIARDNENLLLMLLINPDKKYLDMKEVFDERKTISRHKSILIKEIRDKKNIKQKDFWKEILSVVNIEEWKKINTTEDGLEKIKEIYDVLNKHKEFLDE